MLARASAPCASSTRVAQSGRCGKKSRARTRVRAEETSTSGAFELNDCANEWARVDAIAGGDGAMACARAREDAGEGSRTRASEGNACASNGGDARGARARARRRGGEDGERVAIAGYAEGSCVAVVRTRCGRVWRPWSWGILGGMIYARIAADCARFIDARGRESARSLTFSPSLVSRYAGSLATVVTDATFEQDVLKSDTLVMVDFWAPWCGPCRMIAPLIDQLAEEYQGKLKAVKLNTDESPSIATEYGIRSIPTVMFFKGGQKVDTVIGAVPKSTLTGTIEKYL